MKLLSMCRLTPPYVASWLPRYWCTRSCVHPSSPTKLVRVVALPFHSAIQIWSGSVWPLGERRSCSSIRMPEEALK